MFLLTVIIFSPIQAGFSDRYCRKKSVIVSLSLSAFSVMIILWSQNTYFSIFALFLIIFSKGVVGNTQPISLAGVADRKLNNIRFSMALCTGAMAAGYLVLIIFQKLLSETQASLTLLILFALIIILCILFFRDIRDKEGKTLETTPTSSTYNLLKQEVKLVLQETILVKEELKSKRLQKALLIFAFWEISQYSVHCLNIDLRIGKFSNLTTAMVLGYLIGLFILSFFKKSSDYSTIRIGYAICLLSVVPFFILDPFLDNGKPLLLGCYFFYNLGTVFLAPSLFSILAGEKPSHEQGKIFGLLDSTDTIAFLIATCVAIAYFSLDLPDAFITAFSSIILFLSWFIFKSFECSTFP